MSTREYLDEVIEALKEEYGVSQERAERMIDDTYFAFKIEFNPYIYSDMSLSDVARLIVKTFSNPEFRYQRFYDRVVEHLIRDYEMNADTAIRVMNFNNSKDVFMNSEEYINEIGIKAMVAELHDRYKANKNSDYFIFFFNIRDVLVQRYGLNLEEANTLLRFYNLELVYENLLFYGDAGAMDNFDFIAKSAIQYYQRYCSQVEKFE